MVGELGDEGDGGGSRSSPEPFVDYPSDDEV